MPDLSGEHIVGTLAVLSSDQRTWTVEDRAALEHLAAAVATELERAAAAAETTGLHQRLAVALDAAGIGSWELDPATGEFRGDARLLEMFGMPADSRETRIAEFARLVVPEDRGRVTRALGRSVAEGSDYAEEYQVHRPDGSTCWVAAHGRPMYDPDGKLVRLVGSAYDTTDRRVADQRAAAASGLLALIASASEVLASSLEAADAVRSFARLVVPTLADWSIVSLVDDNGRLEDVDSWHRDRSMRNLTKRFAEHRLTGRREAAGSLHAFASRQPFVIDRAAKAYALRTLRSVEAHEAVARLDLESVAVFPLLSEGREVTGLITLARGVGRESFSPEGGCRRRPVPPGQQHTGERPLLRSRTGDVRAAAAQPAHGPRPARPRRGGGPLRPRSQGRPGRW